MKIEQQQEALETAQINAAVLTSMGMAQIALKNMNINVDQVGIYHLICLLTLKIFLDTLTLKKLLILLWDFRYTI